MTTNFRDQIRPIVRGAYDQQKLRIQTGLRLVNNFKAKLGQAPGTAEEDLSDDAKSLIARLRESYRHMGTAVAQYKKVKGDPKPFVGDELISNETELALVEQYLDLEDQEKRTFKRLQRALEFNSFYTAWLSKVTGIGPAMAGVIISEIDISASKYCSSIWKYAGLDVASDGAGRSRRAEHLVKRQYLDKAGEEQERNSITFNPFLKTKLIGVVGPSFLRAGNEKYVKIYGDYKHRLESHPAHSEKTKGHRHAMAVRYMVKLFLMDLYLAWREHEGLEVSRPYHEAKLGLYHAA